MFSMQLPVDQFLDQFRNPAPSWVQGRFDLHQITSVVDAGQAGQAPGTDRGPPGPRGADGPVPLYEESGGDMPVADEQQPVDGGWGR